MGIQILKLRVKTEDTGRTHMQIAAELVGALRKFDGFIELSDYNVSDTIHEEVLEDLEKRMLSDNQEQFVQDALAQGLEVNYDYSGRGMYGRTCPSVKLDRYDHFDSDTSYSKDSLGMGIVYYAGS